MKPTFPENRVVREGAPAAAAPRWWREIDGEDVGLLVTLVLLAIGGWMAWRPAACLLPALVLAWLTVPPRPKFLESPPPAEPAKRRA